MQFREVGQRVQCHLPWYDSKSKRTRQIMIYSFLAAAPRKPAATDLRAGLGNQEQRQAWANEIWREIFNRSVRQGAADPSSLPLKLNDIAMTIVMQFQASQIPFSAEDMKLMRSSVGTLLKFLEIDVQAANVRARKKGKQA